MFDDLLAAAVVLLPTILSCVAAWLSMKPPAPAKHPRWRLGLIAFGIIISIIIFWQQARSRSSQAASQARLQGSLDDTQKQLRESRLDTAKANSFLSGQVTALTQLTANPPRNPDFKSIAETMKMVASQPAAVREETNKELLNQSVDLARRLREFQKQIDDEHDRLRANQQSRMQSIPAGINPEEKAKMQRAIWDEANSDYSVMHNRQAAEFGPLRAESLALRQKLSGGWNLLRQKITK